MLTVPQHQLPSGILNEFIEAMNAARPVWYRDKCWIIQQHAPHGGGGMAFYLQETRNDMCGK